MPRNPYLLLGVDYGASADAARRAFARAVKRLRRNPDSPVTREDLTAGLHTVESLDRDPFDEVTWFRVPANPEVFAGRGPGVLDPAPRPLPRATEPEDPGVARAAAEPELRAVLDVIAAGSTRFDAGYRFDQGGQQ